MSRNVQIVKTVVSFCLEVVQFAAIAACVAYTGIVAVVCIVLSVKSDEVSTLPTWLSVLATACFAAYFHITRSRAPRVHNAESSAQLAQLVEAVLATDAANLAVHKANQALLEAIAHQLAVSTVVMPGQGHADPTESELEAAREAIHDVLEMLQDWKDAAARNTETGCTVVLGASEFDNPLGVLGFAAMELAPEDNDLAATAV